MEIYLQKPTKASTHTFTADEVLVPNSPHPCTILFGALQVSGVHDVPNATLLRLTNELLEPYAWDARWVWTIYYFTHYHPNCHEALAIISGSGDVLLGGALNGERFSIKSGDVVLIPAGVGHQLISQSDSFRVVGCYPKGKTYLTFRSFKKYREGYRKAYAADPVPPHPFGA